MPTTEASTESAKNHHPHRTLIRAFLGMAVLHLNLIKVCRTLKETDSNLITTQYKSTDTSLSLIDGILHFTGGFLNFTGAFTSMNDAFSTFTRPSSILTDGLLTFTGVFYT